MVHRGVVPACSRARQLQCNCVRFGGACFCRRLFEHPAAACVDGSVSQRRHIWFAATSRALSLAMVSDPRSAVCADGGASVLQTSSSLSCVCFQVTTPPVESTHRFLVEVPRALQQEYRLSQIPYSVLALLGGFCRRGASRPEGWTSSWLSMASSFWDAQSAWIFWL